MPSLTLERPRVRQNESFFIEYFLYVVENPSLFVTKVEINLKFLLKKILFESGFIPSYYKIN
ncbi:hypothetical protein BpHYR1_013507 [Brachionus plicatilis]|uniref:Uncharacterized protein n=1 Tax=Brachionus plicatilis TaxID=10195 RepID=A0A3M7T7V3_BRAPC|nr:hypothetical protein BpHYR1_013507 [Brachionus plicatilis]